MWLGEGERQELEEPAEDEPERLGGTQPAPLSRPSKAAEARGLVPVAKSLSPSAGRAQNLLVHDSV